MKLTRRERKVLDDFNHIEEFYIVRNSKDKIRLFTYRVPKQDVREGSWFTLGIVNDINYGYEVEDDLFPFITWESNKIWSKEELLNLQVEDKNLFKYEIYVNNYEDSKTVTLWNERYFTESEFEKIIYKISQNIKLLIALKTLRQSKKWKGCPFEAMYDLQLVQLTEYPITSIGRVVEKFFKEIVHILIESENFIKDRDNDTYIEYYPYIGR